MHANRLVATFGWTLALALTSCEAKLALQRSTLEGRDRASTDRKLVFVNSIDSEQVAGKTLSPPVGVQVQDGRGDLVQTTTFDVTLKAMTDSTCSVAADYELAGNATRAVAGVATFADLVFAKTGSIYLLAESSGASPACSAEIHVKAGAADHLVSAAGDGQTGFAGHRLAIQPTVQVVDASGNPVADMPVQFTVTGGNGSVALATVKSDAEGKAMTDWQLGPVASADANQLKAEIGDLPGDPKAITFKAASLNYYCDQPAKGDQFQDGSGTASDPFIICTPQQFNSIAATSELLNKNYRLESDLDFTAFDGSSAEKTFHGVGVYDKSNTTDAKGFSGQFDGNGHLMASIKITAGTTTEALGIFNYVNNGTLKNIKVRGLDIAVGTGESAAFVGYGKSAKLYDLDLEGKVTQADPSGTLKRVAGLVGTLTSDGAGDLCDVRGIKVDFEVVGQDAATELVGNIYMLNDGKVTIRDAHTTGSVKSLANAGNTFGGFLAYVNVASGAQLTIEDSSNSADVNVLANGSWSGPFIGTLIVKGANSSATINNVFNTGSMTNPTDYFIFRGASGGFIGNLSAQPGSTVVITKAGSTGDIHITNTVNLTRQTGAFIGVLSADNATVSVADAYSTGDVVLDGNINHDYLGPFIGLVDNRNGATVDIRRSLSTGSIIANAPGVHIGGFIGHVSTTTGLSITDSFWNSDNGIATGINNASPAGLSAQTTSALKTAATFSGWDFDAVWTIADDGFPTLQRQPH